MATFNLFFCPKHPDSKILQFWAKQRRYHPATVRSSDRDKAQGKAGVYGIEWKTQDWFVFLSTKAIQFMSENQVLDFYLLLDKIINIIPCSSY